jgi:hypothetical protein
MNSMRARAGVHTSNCELTVFFSMDELSIEPHFDSQPPPSETPVNADDHSPSTTSVGGQQQTSTSSSEAQRKILRTSTTVSADTATLLSSSLEVTPKLRSVAMPMPSRPARSVPSAARARNTAVARNSAKAGEFAWRTTE